jgi:hypothetical protein
MRGTPSSYQSFSAESLGYEEEVEGGRADPFRNATFCLAQSYFTQHSRADDLQRAEAETPMRCEG